MLIDKIKEINIGIASQLLDAGGGYVAVQMNARDVLEMAQALIAVDDVLKKHEDNEYTDTYRMAVVKEIRKAIEGE